METIVGYKVTRKVTFLKHTLYKTEQLEIFGTHNMSINMLNFMSLVEITTSLETHKKWETKIQVWTALINVDSPHLS